MSVITDRSQGGTSRYPGMVEQMVARISTVSDKRGITEPNYAPMEDVNYTHKILFEFDGKLFSL